MEGIKQDIKDEFIGFFFRHVFLLPLFIDVFGITNRSY
jgi:hypothetical protein